MGCNCKWFEVVVALIIVVFAAWGESIVSATTSMYIVIIAALALLVHAFKCPNCGACMPMDKGMKKSMDMVKSSAAKPMKKPAKKR